MMSRYAFIFMILVLAVGQAVGAGNVNQRMIDMVASGEVKMAVASWWGFDAEDSTDALQAAIDSGAKKLIIDGPGKPWIVRPITLAGNQEIVFRKGVEVVAKRGEFKGKGDCLFRADDKQNITLNGYDATLRMWRSDYAAPPYEDAEWRHTLSLKSCSNIKVYGLTLADSGGDGIYLGTATRGVTNKNIHIKDVTCERHYRQGISVITAENLLIENTVMRETGGTNPQAGIDFEPNRPDERLVNIVMRNCTTERNKGDGYLFYLGFMDATSEPVSVRFENCRSIGDNASSTRVITGNAPEKAVRGRIEYVNCAFEGSGKAGITLSSIPLGRFQVHFTGCSVLDSAQSRPETTPIVFQSREDAVRPIGGIEFVNCTVRDPLERNLMSYAPKAGSVPVVGVMGTIILERNGKRQTIEITPERLREWIPAPK
jgi:hypothetical protein